MIYVILKREPTALEKELFGSRIVLFDSVLESAQKKTKTELKGKRLCLKVLERMDDLFQNDSSVLMCDQEQIDFFVKKKINVKII